MVALACQSTVSFIHSLSLTSPTYGAPTFIRCPTAVGRDMMGLVGVAAWQQHVPAGTWPPSTVDDTS
jgi:hypothetical protein